MSTVFQSIPRTERAPRTRRGTSCPDGRQHRYAPSAVDGYHADGSARTWACTCGASIRFQPWPPVTVGAR
jgi:hypothetical protein